MSERQRVRGTAVDSWFCEARGNLVSNTVMPPFIQKLLALENPFAPFAHFAYFAVRYPPPVFLSQPLNAYKFWYRIKNEAPATSAEASLLYTCFFMLFYDQYRNFGVSDQFLRYAANKQAFEAACAARAADDQLRPAGYAVLNQRIYDMSF